MTAEAPTEQPTGPLDPVHACPGCGCLIIDTLLHAGACARRPDTPEPAVGDVIRDWLDNLDPDQLETDSIANSGFDTNATVAVLDQLKRQAATL